MRLLATLLLAAAVTSSASAATDPYCRWIKQAPADVHRFLPRLEGCAHFAGEEAYNAARRRYIDRAFTRLKCGRIDADLKRMQRLHRRTPWVVKLLDRTNRNEDLPDCGAPAG